MQPQNLSPETLDQLSQLTMAMHVQWVLTGVLENMRRMPGQPHDNRPPWWHTRTDVGTVVSFKLCEER